MDSWDTDDILLSITDKSGRIIYVNKKFCDTSQYTKDEILGKTHRVLKSGYHPDSFYKNLWQTIAKGHVFSGLIKNKSKDGSTYWVQSTMIPILDENSNVSKHRCVSYVVNAPKGKSGNQFRYLIDPEIFKNALDNSASVAITDVNGTITFANDMFCKNSKYSKEELLGSNHRVLKSGYHNDSFYKNLWQTISSGKTWHGDIKNKRKDGTFYWVKTMIMPIFNKEHEIENYIAVRTDITSQIELAEKLTKSERLISIGQLSSRISHDIRNPLSIITVSLENLKILFGTDDAKQKQFEKIDRSIHRIVHQIDDVLDFVRGKHLRINKIKFTEIIEESMDSLTIPNNIELILPKNDVEIYCDKRQCATVMNNLILNSYQSIDNAGTIEITVEETDDGVVIQVKDSGSGISKENLDDVFEPLFTTKQTGTGLGLASVKSIVESHGGIISVTSPPTVFTITLPKINS
jgi:PAS domain S-box-containing protein